MVENAKSISEVTSLLQKSITPLGRREEIRLYSANGRICAENIHSPLSLPTSNNAAVDGFAFHYEWSTSNPNYVYDIVAEIRAGHPYSGKLLPGQAVAIFTGAIVPEELNCIVMQENCILEEKKRVRIRTAFTFSTFLLHSYLLHYHHQDACDYGTHRGH